MYTVYDSKTEAYLQPFFMQSRGAAVRAWVDTIQDNKSQFSKHPSDFTLFEVGEWNEISCEFNIYKNILSLGTALEMISKDKLT